MRTITRITKTWIVRIAEINRAEAVPILTSASTSVKIGVCHPPRRVATQIS